jgi:glycosyltransferase involved in cell wall biosynthesis
MPVGVDTKRFKRAGNTVRTPRSILFLARIAPSKRPDMFMEALGLLLARSVSFVASVYGDALPENESYYASLKARAESLGLHDRVRFHPGVSNEKASDVFRSHQIFVNSSPSGMLDKTIYEAAAAGALVLARSDDFQKSAGEEFHFESVEELAKRLEELLQLAETEQGRMQENLATLAEANSLESLADRLAQEIAP